MKNLLIIGLVSFWSISIYSQNIEAKVAVLEERIESQRQEIAELKQSLSKLSEGQLSNENSLNTLNKNIEDGKKSSKTAAIWAGVISGLLTAVGGWLLAVFGFMKPLIDAQFKKALEKLTEDNEAKARHLIMMAQSQLDWSKAKILIAGENDEVIKELEPTEIKQFRYKQSDITSVTNVNSLNPDKDKFDVVIYRYLPNAQKEDPKLVSFIEALSQKYPNVPLVVYTRGDQINFTGKTIESLKGRGLYTIANNPITLVTNTADAYRISKL